ncbi:MAG: Crp/Fnr family transcriptional regulator [Burkholderiales bacterium]|nr:Crp/Fnr family transcriptional regulator [Burkholderiales bacterium]
MSETLSASRCTADDTARAPRAHGTRRTLFRHATGRANELAWGLTESGVPDVRLGRRDTLLRSGTRFEALYVIRAGSCKLVVTNPDGEEHIVAFCLPGEVIGLEALGSGVHATTAYALEALTCWRIAAERVDMLLRHNGAFARAVVDVLSLDVGRGLRALTMLGTMTAAQRLASFLLDLAERYQQLGFSGSAFELRMTRTEIGDHLGLSTETVSRTLSRLRTDGLVSVSGRSVRLRDRTALGQILLHGA